MAVPSAAVFASHGLNDVVFAEGFDLLGGVETRDREERVTGTATLQPTAEFPVLSQEDSDGNRIQWPREVNFRIALRGNAAAMAHFRRNARIVTRYYQALTQTEATNKKTQPVATTFTTAPFGPGRLQLMSREGSRVFKEPPTPATSCRQPLLYDALAWWEDEVGLWYLELVENSKHADLVTYWRSLTTVSENESQPLQGVNGSSASLSGPSSPSVGHESRGHSMAVYGRAADVLIQLAESVEALRRRQLSLPVCRPEYFRVRFPREHENPQILLFSATTALPLPSFSYADSMGYSDDLPGSWQDEPLSTQPDGTSTSQHDPLFEETLLRKHLRYLAPESVSARRLSPVGDIYSFGVLTFELLTGQTTEGTPSTPDQLDVLEDVHRHVTAEIVSPWDVFQRASIVHGAESLQSIVTPPKELSDIVMRCLAVDVADRYASWASVLYDLRKFKQICTSPGGDLAKFHPGEVDKMSRFHLPHDLVDREREIKALDRVYESLTKAIKTRKTSKRSASDASPEGTVQVVTLYGVSGSGKSVMAQRWVATKEAECLTAWTKLDQHLRKPLSSWVQAFHSLLDRIFSDPLQDVKKWREHLHTSLGPTHMAMLLSIISSEWRRVLAPDSDTQRVGAIDWGNFYPAFRVFSAKLIRTFVVKSNKPLVFVIDDAQWLDKEELSLWQDILSDHSSQNIIRDCLVLCIFRVEDDKPPSAQAVLSPFATVINVQKLSEEGVAAFVSQCLQWSSERLQDNDLVAFLGDQTGGNPFHLRSIMSSLVQDGVIVFDFEILRWKFDVRLLQDHASEGVDSYLQRVLRRLPQKTKRLLSFLACLPSSGARVELLAELAGLRESEVLQALQDASEVTGCIVLSKPGDVSFSHDRQQAAAYDLLPSDQRRTVHWTIAKTLQQPTYLEQHVFDAADNAALALELGQESDDPAALAGIMCSAARQAATSAAFTTASVYLERAESLIDFDSPATWRDHRALCRRFSALYAEVAAVLRDDNGLRRLRQVMTFAADNVERSALTVLIVRLLISTGRPAEASETTLLFVKSLGFDIHADYILPSNAADVAQLREAWLEGRSSTRSVNPLHDNVVQLLAFCGPSLFVTQPQAVSAGAFAVGVSLLAGSPELLARCEGAPYIIGVYCIGSPVGELAQVNLKIGLSTLVEDMCALMPTSYFVAGSLTVNLAQCHAWRAFSDIDVEPSFEAACVANNWDLLTYCLGIGYAISGYSTATFSSRASNMIHWRESCIKVLTPASQIFVDLPLQSVETLISPSSTSEPWTLNGPIVSTASHYQTVAGTPMHVTIWNITQFRLAVLYDAPEEILRSLSLTILDQEEAVGGLIYMSEWRFYQSLFILKHGTEFEHERFKENLEQLRRLSLSKDYRMRVALLEIAATLHGNRYGLSDLPATDRLLDTFQSGDFNLLAGILSARVAEWITGRFGEASRLAQGYLIFAHESYVQAETVGLCIRLRQRYPAVFRHVGVPKTPLSPSKLLRSDETPVRPTYDLVMTDAQHQSTYSDVTTSQSGGTSVSTADDLGASHGSSIDESLDNLTFMRSSLVIAAERDPDVLVCTLLRILSQYVRADFAAIALTSDPTTGSLRLRGAGSSKILPYDLETTSKAAVHIAPVSTMLHVARTGKAITSIQSLRKLRPDPFYGEDRLPRFILVLPLNDQGVVLLSSKQAIAAPAQVAHLVTSLATFAAIALTNSTLLVNLERLVAERTRDLTNALQAKTVFMSHITHELRSPLHSVLGLAAVLEDSPGLSSVQREHLQTIRTSGEDLQTIISNILDFSKLESGSVESESIPFSLRDVVESSLDTVATMAQRKGVEVCLLNAVPEDPNVPIIGDPFRIKQVLLNLLSNAIKFTFKGHVTIRWYITDAQIPDLLNVRLDVEDTGIGILPHKMDRLFKSFSQIDSSITRSYGGSGLGLVISRSLARLLGGDCTATSEYGVGSIFTFTFVAAVEKSTSFKFPTGPVEQSSFVLTGNGPWRRMLHGNLKAFHCNPVTFDDTIEDALTKDYPNGLSGKKRFDFIFLDAELITKDDIKRTRERQAGAKIYYMVQAMRISEVMRELEIDHREVLSLPLKAQSLCNAVIADKDPSERGDVPLSKGGTRINRNLATTHPLKILLVDDSNVNLLVGRKILERFGYKNVDSASDGQQAVDAADKTRYDLILMDLQMPVLDGVSANKRIQASPLAGQPRVVALTANTDAGTREMCTDAGFFSYLSKPLSIPLLERCLIKTAELRSARGGERAGFDLPGPTMANDDPGKKVYEQKKAEGRG